MRLPGSSAGYNPDSAATLPLTADNLEKLRSQSWEPPADQALVFVPRPSESEPVAPTMHIPLSQRVAQDSDSSSCTAMLQEAELGGEAAGGVGVSTPRRARHAAAVSRWDSAAASMLRLSRSHSAPELAAAEPNPAAPDGLQEDGTPPPAGISSEPHLLNSNELLSSSDDDNDPAAWTSLHEPGSSSEDSVCDDLGPAGAAFARTHDHAPPFARRKTSNPDSISDWGNGPLETAVELPVGQAVALRGKSALKPFRAASLPETSEIQAERQTGEPKIRFSEARAMFRQGPNGSFTREVRTFCLALGAMSAMLRNHGSAV